MTARSYLYVPGDRPAMLAEALGQGADALIADLGHAVPSSGKDAARSWVAAWLAAVQPGEVEIWVRVRAGAQGEADVRAVAGERALTGLVVAGPGSLAELSELDGLLSRIGSDARVMPLLQSAAAVCAALAIAGMPRVARMQLDEADLLVDTGIDPGPDEQELLVARSQVVLASAAAGIEPPVASVCADHGDLEVFERSTRAMARLGHLGRACVHPAQVRVANEVFTPPRRRVEQARELLIRSAAGDVDAEGRTVAQAEVRRARRLLQLFR
jgi:citrate lyase subunit beta / citryl-CoA lyase